MLGQRLLPHQRNPRPDVMPARVRRYPRAGDALLLRGSATTQAQRPHLRASTSTSRRAWRRRQETRPVPTLPSPARPSAGGTSVMVGRRTRRSSARQSVAEPLPNRFLQSVWSPASGGCAADVAPVAAHAPVRRFLDRRGRVPDSRHVHPVLAPLTMYRSCATPLDSQPGLTVGVAAVFHRAVPDRGSTTAFRKPIPLV